MPIKFDYAQINQQAKLLDELAADIQGQCIKKTTSACESIEAAWTGDAAKAYLAYIRGVQDDLGKKAKYLRDTAEVLRSAVKKMQQAEQQAQQAAQNI